MLKKLKTNKTANVSWLALLGLLFLFSACGQPEIAPVAIHPEDVCAACKMAISEKEFAAEFVTKDGDAFKFDDLGCMLDHLKNKADRAQISAYFVADFESKEWLKAESAHFVKSAKFATPMGGNIAAFGNQEKAKEAAAKFNGEQVSFAELIGK